MPRDYIPVDLKRLVTERASENCEYCRSPGRFALESMEFDHILPRSKGGETVLENMALACHGCNNHKQNRTEGLDTISEQLIPLYNPRSMQWNDHFAWSEDTTQIIGLTPTGRVTMTLLKMNREGVVNLRRVLHQVGQHPPDG